MLIESHIKVYNLIKLIYYLIIFSLSKWDGQEEQGATSHAEETLADTN